MSKDDGHLVREFWEDVAARLAEGGAALILPHTAGLVIADAGTEQQREAGRAAFRTVIEATVRQADERLRADVQQRGIATVEPERVRELALAMGLGDTDWSQPETAMRMAEEARADLVLAGDFLFEVHLLAPQAAGGLGARQEVRYTLLARDADDGSEVARLPLAYHWESPLPTAEP